MPPIGDVHITKDLPLSQFIAVVKELFRVVDAISNIFFNIKRNPPSTSPAQA